MTTEYSASGVTIKPFSEAVISAHFDVKYLHDLGEARAMTEMPRGHSTRNPSRTIARERGGRSGNGGFQKTGAAMTTQWLGSTLTGGRSGNQK
jgi:hypothetical protein